jgi:Anti-sigma-K factor rskA, C-terminal/Anti-sigma-K factor RskA, N-terminal domain
MRRDPAQPHTLAGAYAVDALDGAERARFEEHLERCGECAREIRGLREATARLADAVAAAPPAGLKQRAMAATAHTRQLTPAAGGTTAHLARRPAGAGWLGPRGAAWLGPRDAAWPGQRGARAGRWVAGLATGLAGAIAAAALLVAVHTRQAPAGAGPAGSHLIAAVLTAPDATMISSRVRTGGIATVVMSGRERMLVFAAEGLRPLPTSRRYELWLMGPGGDRPAGLLPVPRHGMTGPVVASGLKPGDRLGLSPEAAVGARHPTTKMILVVTL